MVEKKKPTPKSGPALGTAPAKSKKPGDSKTKSGDAKSGKKKLPKNKILSTGVYKFSRSKTYHKNAIYKFKTKKSPKQKKEKRPQFVEKKIGGEKNGGTRLVRIKKLRNYYPTAEKKVKKTRNPGHQLFKNHKRTLRKSLTPGTVCILVAGPHRGKRVVFLKQLPSGLLLVTGPFRLNGCPLRRINKIYVIATKTKIDMKGVNVPSHLYNDDYYRRKNIEKRPKRRGGDGDIFAKTKEPYKASDERKNDQKIVDDQLIKALKENHGGEKKLICGYLGSTFSLRNGQYPHRLIF